MATDNDLNNHYRMVVSGTCPVSSFSVSSVTPDSVFQTVRDLGVKIMRDQNEYAKLVERIYQSEAPLKSGRPRSDDSFTKELTGIGDIIAHCLVIGNSKLIHDFVIDPMKSDIASGSLALLTFPDSLENYIDAFKDLAEQSDTETGRIYWSLVIDTFKEAASKVKEGSIAIG